VAGDKVKILYPSDDGSVGYVFLTLLDAGVASGPDWSYSARADIDIPTYLQDVDSQVISISEKNLRQSRWTNVIERLSTNLLTILYSSLKEGATADPIVLPDGEVEVSVFADSKIFSSPLNPNMNTLSIIKNGGDPYIDFPEPISYAEIGIPYQSHMQTLAIEAGEGRTLTDDKKIVDKVGIAVYQTIGGFVGLPDKSLENMAPIKTRDDLDIANPDKGLSGYVSTTIPSNWTKDGMIKIIQVDPAPMTVLSIYPKGLAGD